jgi:hypothetical protein
MPFSEFFRQQFGKPLVTHRYPDPQEHPADEYAQQGPENAVAGIMDTDINTAVGKNNGP